MHEQTFSHRQATAGAKLDLIDTHRENWNNLCRCQTPFGRAVEMAFDLAIDGAWTLTKSSRPLKSSLCRNYVATLKLKINFTTKNKKQTGHSDILPSNPRAEIFEDMTPKGKAKRRRTRGNKNSLSLFSPNAKGKQSKATAHDPAQHS